MMEKGKSKKELLLENEELKLRLAEAEDTLRAIQQGEVDAILGASSGSDRIYTLQGAEHPYRVFFEAMNEGAVTMTLEGTILYCNHRFADLAKVPLEKVIGMSFLDFIVETSRQMVAALLAETGPEKRSVESSLQLYGGRVVPVNISINPFKTADMEAVCAIVTDLSELKVMRRLEEVNKELQASERQLKDSRRASLNIMEDAVAARKLTEEANAELQSEVHERRRSEEKLRVSETKYRSLFENMINGFAYHRIILDEQGRSVDYVFLEVNDAFERLTGLKRSEIVGKRVREVLPGIEKDPADWIGAYGQIALTGSESRFEQYSAQLDKWYSVTVYSPQKDHFVTIFDDITKRKRVEAELLKSQEDLKHAQAVGSIGSWRLDVRRNVLAWSDENYRIFGIPKGMPLTYEIFLSTIHPDDRAYVDTQWNAGLRGEPYDIEHRIVVDGHVKWVREKAYIEFGHDNELIGGFGITQDITELKRAEDEILKLSEDMAVRNLELENANKELEAFSYSVSHDLRSPLRSIDGFSKALLDEYSDRLDAEGRDFLERILSATQKMEHLIDDLLKLSRVSQTELNRGQVDLKGIADQIVAGLKQERPERNVTFIIGEGLSAHGDERLLNIVVENLIGNAWKFTENRSDAMIEFGSRNCGLRIADCGIKTEIENSKSEMVFFVKDNGAGFDMTYADKLFAPFQRLHKPSEFAGTGIGLAIVKRIINRHGGHVWIEGEKDKGATVCFTLP